MARAVCVPRWLVASAVHWVPETLSMREMVLTNHAWLVTQVYSL